MFELFKHKSLITLRTRDIHNHLLPGVDDGFRNPEDSIQAIRTMVEHGVSEIVFTPHMNPDVYPNESESHFRAVFATFQPQVTSAISLQPSAIHLAAEYMVVKDFEHRVADHADELLTYPDGSILIEMSYLYRSRNFEDAIFELGMAGLKPIVAHPERYLYMVDSIRDYERWIDMGASLSMAHGMELAGAGEATGRPVIGVIGDSTFAHSGITSLLGTVYNGGKGTLCILDNRTTAMTGTQGNPMNGLTLSEQGARISPLVDADESVQVES